MCIEMPEVAGAFVIQSGGFGKEERRVEAEVASEQQQTFRAQCLGALVCAKPRGEHGVEQGKRETHRAGFEKGTSGQWGSELEVHGREKAGEADECCAMRVYL